MAGVRRVGRQRLTQHSRVHSSGRESPAGVCSSRSARRAGTGGLALIWQRAQAHEPDDGPPRADACPGRKRRRLPSEPDLRDPSLYFDRDLGWLSFNQRVLEQAKAGHPLLERVKFFAIAANNLDEFFMVRLDQADSRARAGATGMLEELGQFWQDTLRPQLAAERIHILDASEYTDDDRAYLSRIFNVDVCPVLTPLAFDPGHPFPLVSNRSKNLAVVVEHKGRTKFARVKVPDLLPRFVALPREDGIRRYAMLEDVIRENLGQLFPGVGIRTAHMFRVVRDMEVAVANPRDTAETILEVVDRGLKEQQHGPVSLLEVEHSMPTRVLDLLVENFEASRDVIVRTRGRMGFADWMALAAIPRPGSAGPAAEAGQDLAQGLAGDLRRDPRPRPARAPPVRLVPIGRVVCRRGHRRSARRGHQDDALSHRRELAGRRSPDQGGRARQAGRGARRAESAIRRTQQHRMGETARGCRRARGLRRGKAEDPLQDLSRRPEGRRRDSPLRAHRHGQLQPDDVEGVYRHRPLYRAARASSPTCPSCSTT